MHKFINHLATRRIKEKFLTLKLHKLHHLVSK